VSARTRTELPRGIAVGHWTHEIAQTGCSVVLAEGGAVAGVDVRGGGPGTLGTDGLRPGTIVEQAQAIVLTGRSMFGLEAVGGVMRFLEERGVGLELGGVKIPAVAAAVIFDMFVGDARVRPDAAAGYAACRAAVSGGGGSVASGGGVAMGAVGVGTGATVAKAGGGAQTCPGGVGVASARIGETVVAAIMAVNSVGGVWDDEDHRWIAPLTTWDPAAPLFPGANTTIGVIMTDAVLTKEQACRLATVGHDGIARAVRPAHTMFDGDTLFAMGTGLTSAPYDGVEVVATELVARAIAAGVRAAQR
jgi:L-aminopeptidase/D-esterase-like protein